MKKRVFTLLLAFMMVLTLAVPAFAARLESSQAKSVFRMMNEERDAAGVEPYKWDDDLAEAAEVRALELCEKYTQNHTRPDGRSYLSVSTKVIGENTAWGYKTADAAMNGWMNSELHKENILSTRYTITAAACAQADNGTMYWVQLFGDGKSNASWAKQKSYTFDPFSDGSTKTDSKASESSKESDKTSSSSGSTALIDKNGKITAAGAAAELKKGIAASNTKDISLHVKGATSISAEALKAMATASGDAGKTLTIQADTMDSTGKSMQGRMILVPSKLTGRKTDIKLGVYTDSNSVKSVKAKMEQKYKGNMAYIHMEHSGSLTVSTRIVAKVKLDGLDNKNLLFYVYNSKSGTVTLIEKPNYAVDSKGFVTFHTKTGGDIVITDKALS